MLHSNSSHDSLSHAAFIKDHTLTSARQTPTSLDLQGPTCINDGTQERWKKKEREVAGPSWDAIKLMRFPEFLWIEPDAKYITSNKLTSNYWCGAPLPDVQQMGAGATKGVSTRALCYSAVKRQYSCMCFKSPWAVGWRWREGQGDSGGKMKAHH